MHFLRFNILHNAKRMYSSKVSQKADYKIVDHVYDAVVVGAGTFLCFVKLNFSCVSSVVVRNFLIRVINKILN